MNKLEASVQAASQASNYASSATYSGASVGIVGVLGGIDWIAIAGLTIAAAGFIVNLYYKAKENRRAEELHAIRKTQIEKGKCYED
ncbi:MAG: holin [Neisseria sp.]|mgnify:CR=1 FL=1|nr:holin [Neisseria sp.]